MKRSVKIKDIHRTAHLVIMMVMTLTVGVVGLQVAVEGWGLWAVIVMVYCLGLSWWLHISKKLDETVRTMIYAVEMSMLMFYFGANNSDVFDTSIIVLVLTVLFVLTDSVMSIHICFGTYMLAVIYRLVIMSLETQFDMYIITKVFFHVGVALLDWRLCLIVVQKHTADKRLTDDMVRQLEESNAHTEDFMANISHELRTPINAVTGIAAVMLDKETDAGKREDIVSMLSAGERLMHQISDILDFAETDGKRLVISSEEYMITSVINDVVIRVNQEWASSGLEFVIDMDPRIPAVMTGDSKKITKIILHLVDNAFRFTEKGGVYLKLYTVEKPYGVNLCIQVRDTGIGINEEEAQRVMSRFYKSDSGKLRRASGLGLGLAIVNGFVEAMDGFVFFDTSVRGGAMVCVSLPQTVTDKSPCMAVSASHSLCAVYYLKAEKFDTPAVRDFYGSMINTVASNLGVKFYSVSDIGELEKIRSSFNITHIFTGEAEYNENPGYFGKLDGAVVITVVSDGRMRLRKSSRINTAPKPFYALPIVNALNSQASSPGKRAGKTVFPGIHALTVDDEEMNLVVAKGILSGFGIETDTAPGGAAALELCKKKDYDIIFLDHMMPEMDGIQTLINMKKLFTGRQKQPAIVTLTANAVSGAREMFLSEGFDEFVTKPIELTELERVLKKMLPDAVRYDEESAAAEYEDAGGSYDGYEGFEGYDGSNSGGESIPEPVADDTDSTIGTPGSGDFVEALARCGFAVKDALGYCVDSRELYRELVEAFISSYDEKLSEIESFYAAEDWYNYRIRVHALKSTSKMIGASELSELALDSENASKAEDAEHIRENHKPLTDKYALTAGLLRKAMYGDSTEHEAAPAAAADKIITPGELSDRLEETVDCLRTFDCTRAGEIIDGLMGYSCCGQPLDGILTQAKELISDFDTQAAELALAGLYGKLSVFGEPGPGGEAV